MRFADICKKALKLTADNSPTILASIAVTGSVTTAYLAGRASFKASRILAEQDLAARLNDEDGLETREKLELVWKLYVPTVLSGAATIACIIGSNHIGNRRAAAMAVAYTLSEKAYTEYREKVIETYGENKERAIRDKIAQDHVTKDPVSSEIVMVSGDVLCRDDYSGRYFTSSVEKLNAAKNDTNAQVINDFYASLTDFYYRIGLSRTSVSDEFGWNVDQLLDLSFSTALTDDSKPCLVVSFKVNPIRGYSRIN
jgi:hypothetical protein